jgi:hypothetical protein
VTHGDGTASIQPYSSLPRLFFSFTRGAEFLELAGWFYNFVYPREQER